MSAPFRIWAKVSGGVTGTREAWLKADGAVREFNTRDEAEAVAAHLNRTMNHANSRAQFAYKAIREDGK